MTMTPLTNTKGSYLPAVEFLKRVDVRTVGELCDDTGGVLSGPTLISNDKLKAALDTASGMFEAALLKGGRYTPADIMALPPGSAGQAALYGMLSWVTMTLLWERRPTYANNPAIMQRAESWLQSLANGDTILSFQEAAESGVLEPQPETTADVDARKGISWIVRGLLGRRANRWP